MESELDDYITFVPLEDAEFFDGFNCCHVDEVKEKLLLSMAVPSELYANRNGNIYPSSVRDTIESILDRHHIQGLDLTQLLVGDWPELEDHEEEEDIYIKVNWKEEGF